MYNLGSNSNLEDLNNLNFKDGTNTRSHTRDYNNSQSTFGIRRDADLIVMDEQIHLQSR